MEKIEIYMLITKDILTKIERNLVEAINVSGTKMTKNQIKIDDWECPHKTKTLPNGKMAVYAFFLNDQCLKIGKSGPNSNARFNSQHYNPKNSKSNLAKSILSDKDFPINNITEENIGDWIRENTRRINLLIDQELGIFVLNFCEAYMQLCFKPKYEGFENQRNIEKKYQKRKNRKV